MFKVNDTVSYGTAGVCKISEIAEKQFSGKTEEYYVLKPIYSEASTIFVPTGNEFLQKKMHRILSVDEIEKVILSVSGKAADWIENEKERKEKYREALLTGDHIKLIGFINTIYLRRTELIGKTKRIPSADEHFLKDAEKLLYDEFAHVLKIKRDEVLPYIVERLRIDAEKNAQADDCTESEA